MKRLFAPTLLSAMLFSLVVTASATTEGTAEVEGAVTGGEMVGEMTDVTVQVAESDTLGAHLVDGEGMTLYLFLNDSEGVSTCEGECAANWPPLLTDGNVVAGEGVDPELLGTTERSDGSLQVTYNGWPLYFWVQDVAPGDATGQGVNDVWYVVSPEGEAITEEQGASAEGY
ncbi:COG4315 family predicted lipoprotein [Truepera radiovictrix]|uniref:Lipoprotein n=1 Tax=Truepera radiovictrix (strain DSM 17093 / CIP 108686 / LMG 22925 / RQ-24) TaxID=649638 RepID=D7CRU5_TRURR|nr:hypothetical protein [Truepera radiovictrix]ADI15273.1 Secreted repeat of unknown function [Truepera radiovictrix DSM 17093]WMT56176.1 hypothetical protein RCV51_09160 [Truepera radiovictrix]